jgi:DNA-binding protein H-NS
MPHVDLSEFTVEELEELRHAIDEEKMRRQNEERERILAEARDAAARYGMSVNQFLKANEKKRRVSAAPKYRNPDNPKQMWSGRGKQPAWVQKALATGADMGDLEQDSTSHVTS